MKKLSELEASDFPNVDKQKFQEWKNAMEERVKKAKIYAPISIAMVLIGYIFEGFIFTPIYGIGLIAVMILALPINIKYFRLKKELGITSKDIRQAR